ncbi:Uncharacterized protein dnm_064720 [Desulfonema magnum]|uniref:Uncharacterized protein n=1 Tax=Desulfonema magnum TaxID=45655 RepID=A0A975BRQ1_9BACT|nr:Uncharacterized protein dnm_064720 [Desulfonema magnum]
MELYRGAHPCHNLCQDRHPESLCDGTAISIAKAFLIVRTDTRNLYVMEQLTRAEGRQTQSGQTPGIFM